MKKIVLILCAVVCICAIPIGCGNQPSDNVVSIAVVAPITGKYSDFGKDIANGVQLAVDEANAAGGVNGHKIELIVEDEKSAENDAVAAAHLVCSKNVVGVIGHGSSGATLAASPVYNENGLTLIVPAATNPTITRQGFNNIFRIPTTDDLQGPAIADFVVDRLGAKKVAILHNKGAYGEGLAQEFKKKLNARGLQELAYQGVNPEDKDFRAVLTELKPQGPDVIFYGGEHPDASLLIKQARDLGLQGQFVMGDGCFSPELIALAGTAAEGAVVSNIAPMSSANTEAQRFYTEFTARFGKIVAFAPLAYESADILLDAVSKADSPTKESVLRVLQAPDYSYEGILGKTAFGKNGDSKGKRLFFHVIQDGRFVAYE